MIRIITDDNGSSRSVRQAEQSPDVFYMKTRTAMTAFGLTRHQLRNAGHGHRERHQHRTARDRTGRRLRQTAPEARVQHEADERE
jgi:hypothetical protein